MQQPMDSLVQIVGRSSSHYTRMAQMFALELGVPYQFVPIYDMASTDAQIFAGNPALKMPVLRRVGAGGGDGGGAGNAQLFGTENICRALAELAPARRVVWPEELRGDLSRNAQEMVWHAASSQVQLVLGTLVGKLPAEHPFFTKIRAGFDGAMAWLDRHLALALAALDEAAPQRAVSLFEVALFCTIEHLRLRESIPLLPYPALRAFAERYGARASAARTPYQFDAPPAPGS